MASPRPATPAGVLDPANLFAVMETLRARNGQAPGADRVRYTDLSAGEWFQLFRDVRADVLAGRYRPQPARTLEIPKLAGGTRTLRLPTAADRVLAKAVANAVEPAAERVFLPCSYGFRPNTDRLDLLADLKLWCETNHAWVITADDVRSAFDTVDINHAIGCVRRLGVDPDLADLAERILRGHEEKEVGIAQGCPLSPLVLNTILHYAIDHPMTVTRDGRHPVRLMRYADNVLTVTRTAAEGREHLERMRTLLTEIGMSLKGDPGAPRDLREDDRLHLLGVSLTGHSDRLRLQTPHASWTDLQSKLVEAHTAPHPYQTAHATALGWVRAHAPTFDTVEDEMTRNRLNNIVRRTGHRDVISPGELSRLMQEARLSWTRRLQTRSGSRV